MLTSAGFLPCLRWFSKICFLFIFGAVSHGQVTPIGIAGNASTSDVLTYHFDNARTGWYRTEFMLKPSNVNSTTFGLVGFLPVDGRVDAQPLYLNNVTISGVLHNVIYAVTEHDSAYAFDADTRNLLWQVSALQSGETPSDDQGCGSISPEIGITDTPVIDRMLGPHGAIYFVSMSKDSAGHYHQRLHALDVTTGVELFGGPQEIQASYPGTGDGSQGGFVIFNPGQYAERVALLELNHSSVYLTFTSHCDHRPYTGWVLAYSATTLAQQSVLNVTPNGNEGAVWMSGGGMAADMLGNIYFIDGNGTFDTTLDSNGFPNRGDYGNAFIKLGSAGGLSVADYFATFDNTSESRVDQDLGAGGAVVLPDLLDAQQTTHHLVVGAGKDTNIYVADRDNMGKYDPNGNNANVYQWLQGVLPGGTYSTPAYFNNTLYYGPVGHHLMAFGIVNAKISSTPTSQTTRSFLYPGTTPAVSGSAANAIVWAIVNSRDSAILCAYDATNLALELYNSSQQGTRDQFGPGNKFITPIIANGKVFVGTRTGIAVFGLLH